MVTTEPTINSLRNKLSQVRARLSELEVERSMLAVQADALAVVIQMYSGNALPTIQSEHKTIALSELTSMTLSKALEEMARANGGVLNMAEARRTLLESGRLKSPTNAGPRIYTLVIRSEKYEKVSPGKYRLLNGTQAVLPMRPSVK